MDTALAALFSTILLAAHLASSSAIAAEPPVPFNRDKPLQVVINDQVFPRANDAWTTPSHEQDRFVTLTGVLEKKLQMAGVMGLITFERWGRNVPEADQRLEITLQRWEVSPMSFGDSLVIECSFWAVLTAGGQKFDMGVFRGQDTHVRMRPELFEDDFRPAAEEAVINMIEFFSAAVNGRTFARE